MGPLIRTTLLGIALVLAAATGVSAQVPLRPAPDTAKIPLSRIPRVHRAPKLEDFLENQPREAELTVTNFRQNSPGDGAPATEPTTAYLSYDDKNLYVVFVCQDESGAVRAHLSRREGSDQDDGVGVLLDTFRDFHRAYFFFSNPLGVQTDAIYTEGQGYDLSFDTLWGNAGRVTKTGYIVFFAIPFKSLRFSHGPEQTWGVALYRTILRKSEYDYWPYVTQRVEGLTQQFAPVGGIENVSPGRNIQLIPYGLLASDHFLNQPGGGAPPMFLDKFEHRAGLDAKFVVKDSFSFDVTLNPDFSQVESDDPQVTVNQRFAVFFPEKRPFFIENAGFFATPIDLFFSRQIAHPQFGSRMTGKLGKWTLGALAIDDRQPGQGFTSGPYDTRAVDGVVRVTREFGNQSYIGGFFSSRDFADTSNRVASIDARLKFSKNWVADVQGVHSAASNCAPLELGRGCSRGAQLDAAECSAGTKLPVVSAKRARIRIAARECAVGGRVVQRPPFCVHHQLQRFLAQFLHRTGIRQPHRYPPEQRFRSVFLAAEHWKGHRFWAHRQRNGGLESQRRSAGLGGGFRIPGGPAKTNNLQHQSRRGLRTLGQF